MAGREQGTELQPVVDEAEEERKEAEAEAAKGNAGPDWDTLCAYKTFKVVRIKDRQLGFCYWGIVLGVVLYIVVFAFSIGGKHQDQRPGVGTVLTNIIGKTYAGGKVFDPADLRFPVIEPNGAFLLTRRIAVKQKRGMCVDMDHPKQKPCGPGEKENGLYCEVKGWCPSIGDSNAEKPPKEAKVDRLMGVGSITLKIMAGINFPGLSEDFYVAGASPGAESQFKNITVDKLLSLAKTPPKDQLAAMDTEKKDSGIKLDEALVNSGALIGVSFFWNCETDHPPCEPSVLIKKLDSGQGFVQKRATYFRNNGEEMREALYLNGLRLLVDSSGIGRKASMVLAVIQLGSAIALIRVAAIVADNIMLYSFQYTKDRRTAYYKCKVHETEDFSDLQDRIHRVNEAKGRNINSSKAGANVDLGMGPFGRAGMASSIVKGRSHNA